MNKNRYKLIFSQVKACFVPVAENIKSTKDNALSSNIAESQENSMDCEVALNPIAACIKAELTPVQISPLFSWKNISFLLLTSIALPTFADSNAVVNGTQTTVIERPTTTGKGNVLIIDIAKPEHDGVSDNRFSKFNVPNGAVFNNSLKNDRSQLVGDLYGNKHFSNQSAKAILNQVSGAEMSKIQGALEVFGDRADLIIVNPTGIELNGVKTINTDRFVAAAANVTGNNRTLTTSENGKVVIEEKGVATNGLSYFDVVAKTITQKGAVGLEAGTTDKDKKAANITFAAGSLEYDLTTHNVTGKNQSVNDGTVAISGELAGAMHGKHIQFITTDTGAGVKHQGTILSENDINITTKDGNIEVKKLYTKQKIGLTGKNATVSQDGVVYANESIALNLTNNVTLEQSAKVYSNHTQVHAKNVAVKEKATLIAQNLTVNATESITNNGTIAGIYNELRTKKLINNKDAKILAEKNLNIAVKGKKLVESEESADKKTKTLINTSHEENGYQNKGLITSNGNATLTFTGESADTFSDFVSEGNFLPNAQEHLQVNANNILISQNDSSQQTGKFTLNATGRVVNQGLLSSGDKLEVNSTSDIVNLGLLGGKNGLNLTTSEGDIYNLANGTLHSLGETHLASKNKVYNLGEIYSEGKIYVKTNHLENDVLLANKINSKGSSLTTTYLVEKLNHTIELSGTFFDIDAQNIKPVNIGKIYAGKGFEFNSADKDKSSIVNHGLLNVKGDLTYDAKSFTNNMKSVKANAYEYIFKPQANITVKHTSKHLNNRSKFLFSQPMQDREKILTFNSLADMMEAIFNKSDAFPTEQGYIRKSDLLRTLAEVKSPSLVQSLQTIFGVGWQLDPRLGIKPEKNGYVNDDEYLNTLKAKWEAFKNAPEIFDLYPTDKAKVLADKIVSKNNEGILQNGHNAENSTSQSASEFHVGNHKINVPDINFSSFINQEGEQEGLDLSTLLELLAQPQLFIDRSGYREAPRENAPNVETDALYRTRLHYINQDDYIGSKYFFNKIASGDSELNKSTVIGDNYFEHQLITRSIQKKVDNHLSLKYNLSDIQLVKKLMDNASGEASGLNLTIGQALTKEQQANLKEDIIWYVKTKLNDREVLVPQVYFAKQTLEEVEKFRGVGNAVIRARELNVHAKDIKNSGTIAGERLNLKAENKIVNSGDILSQEEARLIGKKGIESIGETYIDDQGNTKVRKSRIKSEGHLYLGTDKDSDVNLTASDVSGKTGQIKTKNLNLNETYQIEQSYVYEELKGANGRDVGHRVTKTAKAESVGTEANFDHLHLSVEGDVNQNGSNLKTKRLTGVVKGDYNTTAGKTFTHQEIQERTTGTELSASVSGGGISTGVIVTDEGTSTFTNKTTGTSANAEAISYVKNKINRETALTHKNSDLEAQSGELYVLNKADIGGLDINKNVDTPTLSVPISDEQKAEKTKASTQVQEIKKEKTKEINKQAPKFKTLTDKEIEEAFEDKDLSFFESQKENTEEEPKKGFTLSAKRIDSTKAKDERETYSYEQKISFGVEGEAHSAIADAASNIARQALDAEKGIKQDATAALQAASDAANLVTGDVAGASGKFKVEVNTNEKSSKQTEEKRSIIGGRTNLEAREGDITLNNVESTEDSQLSLRARDNVNVNAGVSTSQGDSEASHTKVTAGATVNCGVMAGGCTAGVNAGVSGSYTESKDKATSYKNSLLKGKSLNVETGKDFNLIGSNVDADHLHLDVKGDTNIVSKQDTYSRKERGVNYSASAGAGVSTSLAVKPNGSVGGGVSVENEESHKVNQQAGISANKITGEINNLNLTGAYLENRQGHADNFRVKGNVTARSLIDTHHKDGGSFGGAAGVSETGIAQLNVNGGRVEQKHYEAIQYSTLSGITTEKPVNGEVKSNRNEATQVTRDDTYASTNFSFEVMDLVEVGQRVKDKVKNRSNTATSEDASTGTPVARQLKQADDVDAGAETRIRHNSEESVKAEYKDADVATPTASAKLRSDEGQNDTSANSLSTRRLSKVEESETIVETPSTRSRVESVKAESAEAESTPVFAPRSMKSRSSEQNGNEDISALVSKAKVEKLEVEDIPSPLSLRSPLAEANVNSNNNGNDSHSSTSVSQSISAASSTTSVASEKLSLFQRLKNFVTGTKSRSEQKAEASEAKSAEVNSKPNYDDLEDNLNLKGLLALENKRNESFEQKVLKNEEFLGEARELAKKLVPESVIKQMGDSPELDEILTGGAKKVEKRINDALTFQPKAEEFAEIQQLVKRLPKGEAIDSIEEKTKRITEALAETSKTIQRNPKLQEEIEGAIGDFLKRSQNEELTVDMIEKLNYGLRPDEGEGRELYKKETLTKENAVFSSPASSKIQLAETVAFINQAKASGVEPSVLAGLVYQRLIAYHPFAEGNGRMARVLVNKLLLDAGYPAFTKFNEKFETQIIPQTEAESKSATSSEVITEFLKELSQKPLPQKTSGDSAIKNTPENVSAGDSTITGRVSEVSAEVTTEKAAILSSEYKAETEAVQLTPRAAKSEETPQLKQAKTETAEVESEEALPTTYTKATQPIEAGVEMDLPNDVVQKPTPVSDRVKNRELIEQPRALLDKIKDTFQPLKVGGKIKDVRDSATEYGGEVSFPFAQSKGEVYKQIIKHAETQNGVCESTCAHWIAKKVQDDQSLWNELYNGGTKAGKLNQEAIDSIKKLQSEFINAGSATQQFKLTEEWLSEKGVIAKQRKVGDFSRKDEVSGTVSSKNVDALVKAILDTGEQSSGIKKISINLKGGSHTVSASVEGNKVVFFDPNFGEITFPSHDKFEAWIKNAFWQKSGYAGNDDSKRFFNVVNYHKDK